MTLTTRDRRALLWLAGMIPAAFLIRFILEPRAAASVQPASSIPALEARLDRMRKQANAVPGRNEALRKIDAELALREKGLVQAETAAQAQAQLVQIVRRIWNAQSPPVEIRSIEPTQPKVFNDHYGEVSATVTANCGIEQIVNLLADLSSQSELIATTDMVFSSASGKEKRIQLRMTVTGLVPRKLIPEKKAGFAF